MVEESVKFVKFVFEELMIGDKFEWNWFISIHFFNFDTTCCFVLFSFQIIYNKCRNFIQICSIEIYEHLNKCRKGNVISKKKKKKLRIMNAIKVLWKWIGCI